MDIVSMLDAQKKRLKELQKRNRIRQYNKDTEKRAQFLFEVGEIRGDLRVCGDQFKIAIHEQAKSVRDGIANGFDTLVQQQALKEAAVGYLLVRDALFALNGVVTNDTVSHAYEILDSAVKRMSNKKPNNKGYNIGSERGEHGYITAPASVENKERYVATFFNELVKTGNIDACIEKVPNPAAVASGLFESEPRQAQSADTDGLDDPMAILNSIPGASEDDDVPLVIDNIDSVLPPDI